MELNYFEKVHRNEITVNPKINARGVYLIFRIYRGRLLEGGVYSKVKKSL